MSILVYAESWDGKFRKSTLEAVSYAKKTASVYKTDVKAISFGNIEESELSLLAEYGVNKIISYPEILKNDGKSVA